MRTSKFVPVLLGCLSVLAGADGLPKEYTALAAKRAVVVDGKLDDAAWKGAAWTDWFVDIEGPSQANGKPKPRFKTRAKMSWDADYFYVCAEMEEPALWATYDKHDMVIFHENDFEVFLDPDGDGLHYFEFEINALNTGWDLYLAKPYKDGGKADDGWEIPGLKTAVGLRGTLNQAGDKDQGWVVEMAFPWSAFNRGPRAAVAPRVGESWRVNFSRVEWLTVPVRGGYKKVEGKKEDNWVWSPQGVINMHVPEKWGIVKFR
jgi:hypothetical protein